MKPRAKPGNENPIHPISCTCWRCLDAERRIDQRIVRIVGTLLLIAMLCAGATIGLIIRALILWARS